TSPLNEWEAMKPTIKGHHYRLTHKQYNTICDKWGFSSIPSYVIIGKDGLEKDFHTGFKGTDYYKVKIEEELKK
ncbi:MAG: TlpA family protein disulfide reductase, partial [Bacteroidales bacterium]|nr:TlpA family protein disulfide reductase [Bacteroidales bacterium]